MTDMDTLGASLLDAVPFASTLGLQMLSIDPGAGRAEMRLPDSPALHNHVGGPHAAALFGLGETASGAVVLAVFAKHLANAVPLAVSAQIRYRKLARGAVLATAVLDRPASEVIAELESGGRPEFPVRVQLSMEDGTVTTEMVVDWTLRPNRPAS